MACKKNDDEIWDEGKTNLISRKETNLTNNIRKKMDEIENMVKNKIKERTMNLDRKCLLLNISKAGVIREKKDIRELLKRKKNIFNKGVITTSLLVSKNTFENKKNPFPYIKYEKKKINKKNDKIFLVET